MGAKGPHISAPMQYSLWDTPWPVSGWGVLPSREALEGGLLGQRAGSQTLAFLPGAAGTAGQSLRLAMGQFHPGSLSSNKTPPGPDPGCWMWRIRWGLTSASRE